MHAVKQDDTNTLIKYQAHLSGCEITTEVICRVPEAPPHIGVPGIEYPLLKQGDPLPVNDDYSGSVELEARYWTEEEVEDLITENIEKMKTGLKLNTLNNGTQKRQARKILGSKEIRDKWKEDVRVMYLTNKEGKRPVKLVPLNKPQS